MNLKWSYTNKIVNDLSKIDRAKDDKLIISIQKKKKISLSGRFKEYKGKNLAKEFSWDESVGKEIELQ